MTQVTRRRALTVLSAVPLLPLLARAASATVDGAVMEDLWLGKEGAPVTIIEYASMTCPHCAHFEKETFPKLKEKYIDTGKVRFAFRDFPFDRLAVMGSVLARCSGPNRYYGMTAVLFQQQVQWAHSQDPLAELGKLGRLAGLSKERIDTCLADKSMVDAVLNSRLQAQKQYEVDSTPTFIINGSKHSGALSIEEMDKLIEPLLN